MKTMLRIKDGVKIKEGWHRSGEIAEIRALHPKRAYLQFTDEEDSDWYPIEAFEKIGE